MSDSGHLSSMKLDFNQLLFQIIIPGFTTGFPFYMVVFYFNVEAKRFMLENVSMLSLSLLVLSLTIGMLLEDIGSLIEVNFFDKKREKENGDFKENWEKYLKKEWEVGKEPVGHRYLRNTLKRMKFELSMSISMLPFTIGLLWNFILSDYKCWVYWFLLIPIFLFFYLLYEANLSSQSLAKTRRILLS